LIGEDSINPNCILKISAKDKGEKSSSEHGKHCVSKSTESTIPQGAWKAWPKHGSRILAGSHMGENSRFKFEF